MRDGHFAALTRRGPPPHGLSEHAALTQATVLEDELDDWGDADTALVRPDGHFAWLGLGDHRQAAAAYAPWNPASPATVQASIS